MSIPLSTFKVAGESYVLTAICLSTGEAGGLSPPPPPAPGGQIPFQEGTPPQEGRPPHRKTDPRYPRKAEPPRKEDPPPNHGQCAVGTHPTGMRSCCICRRAECLQMYPMSASFELLLNVLSLNFQ